MKIEIVKERQIQSDTEKGKERIVSEEKQRKSRLFTLVNLMVPSVTKQSPIYILSRFIAA